MTKLVWCEQGHRYDKELSPDCPECRARDASTPEVDREAPRPGKEEPASDADAADNANPDDARRPAG